VSAGEIDSHPAHGRLRACAATDTGLSRALNEDTHLVDEALGLYLVLDGMGGHNAGDVAARLACAVIAEEVRAGRRDKAPHQLLRDAVQAASRAVFDEARAHHGRRGMGTTVVACLEMAPGRVLVAHVGDSRAYLWRAGQLRLLTRDHSVVAELVAAGALRPEEASEHPYRNVLSRNLGIARPVDVDLVEVALQPGDRLLLCSDGLSSFAAADAMAAQLAQAGDGRAAVERLIALALRGGGGDNITAVVLEAPPAESSTWPAQLFWRQRIEFLREAAARGLADSPVCEVPSAAGSVERVAGDLFDALHRDLADGTSTQVWQYAETLASGWLTRHRDPRPLQALWGLLADAAAAVIARLGAAGEAAAPWLEAAATRALLSGELALASVLASTARRAEVEAAADDTGSPTLPLVTAPPATRPLSAAASACLEAALIATDEVLAARHPGDRSVRDCLMCVHRLAVEDAGAAAFAVQARLLCARDGEPGGPALEPAGLLDGLDRARAVHLDAVAHGPRNDAVRAEALCRLGRAYEELYRALAELVVAWAAPIAEELAAVVEQTAALRSRVGRGEERLLALERAYVARQREQRAAGPRRRG
jgi:protein phosphatase